MLSVTVWWLVIGQIFDKLVLCLEDMWCFIVIIIIVRFDWVNYLRFEEQKLGVYGQPTVHILLGEVCQSCVKSARLNEGFLYDSKITLWEQRAFTRTVMHCLWFSNYMQVTELKNFLVTK